MIENTTVLPVIVAGKVYQCGAGVPGSGPYFQYCVPAGSAAGYAIVNVTVEPGVQLPSAKSNSPCGNTIAVEPAGGLAGSPVSEMKLRLVKVQFRPPPVKTALMVPLPVADGAIYDRTTALGVTLAGAEAGPLPTAFTAITEQL